MNLRYRQHAKDRMAERNITEPDIINCINNYTDRRPTQMNSIRYLGPGVDGRALKVWVFPDDEPGSEPPGSQRVVKSVAWKGDDV